MPVRSGHMMSAAFSLYLDLVRFGAALLVCLFHSSRIAPGQNVLMALGPEAVIVFFVLSGYVIAYVAETKERTLRQYFISRIARIGSVAIPAIFTTGLVDFIGYHHFPDAYPAAFQAWSLPLVRVASSVLFLDQIWLVSIQLFSNVPYWSLNYEIWYYIGFACLMYADRGRRWWLFLAVCVFVGPKIMVLMPIWWLGAWLYRSRRLRLITPGQGAILLAISGAAMFFYLDIRHLLAEQSAAITGAWLYEQLNFSKNFLSYYYVAFAVALHFLGIRALAPAIGRVLLPARRPIRYVSSCTFTLYLMHQPLLFFYTAIFRATEVNIENYMLVLAATLATSFILATLTEHKKDVWRKGAATLWGLGESFIVSRSGRHHRPVREAD